jgi:hypothetical protein
VLNCTATRQTKSSFERSASVGYRASVLWPVGHFEGTAWLGQDSAVSHVGGDRPLAAPRGETAVAPTKAVFTTHIADLEQMNQRRGSGELCGNVVSLAHHSADPRKFVLVDGDAQSVAGVDCAAFDIIFTTPEQASDEGKYDSAHARAALLIEWLQ